MALTSKQEQHAGNASNQYQANQIIVNNGLTSEQAMRMFQSMIPAVLSSYQDMAACVAKKRIDEFENELFPKLKRIEGALENFKDPAFQMQLHKAQMSAAVTGQESDIDMLSQLMIKHIEVKEDRNKKLGVTKAIEIIDEVDNQALVALTVLYVWSYLISVKGDVYCGLNILENIYHKLLYLNLPEENIWIDHLELLNTIRTYRYSTNIKIKDICVKSFEGYATAGIKKDSINHQKANDLLQSVHMNNTFLVNNPLLDGYLVLPCSNKNALRNAFVNDNGIERLLTQKEIDILFKIFDLYDNRAIQENAINNFIGLWDTYPTLKKVHDWTDKIPFKIDLTMIGLILATTNLKRIMPELNNLDIIINE